MSLIPLRLAIDIQSPDGTIHNRWGLDEPNPSDVPSALTFSTTMPGGFEQLDCTLPRQPSAAYVDLEEFSTITVYGVGGETAWQGRLETTPRTSGDRIAITPGAVGWQAHLDDDNSAQEIYVDQSLQNWTEPSRTRQLAMTVAGVNYEPPSLGSVDATNGLPALVLTTTFPTPSTTISESIYDAGPACKVAAIRYAFNTNGVDFTNANWTWGLLTYTDDTTTSSTGTTGDLGSAASGSAYFTPAAPGRVGYMFLQWNGAAGGAGQRDELHWQAMAVYGNHGLTRQTSVDPNGFLASDIVTNAVTRWAPKLSISRAGISTIEASTFVIPHLVFRAPTTASDIIKQATRFGLPDWWVDEGPTFNLASRDNHGRQWQARVGPSGLSETGPQVDRLFNSVVVSYTDTSGVTRTVGPTGSGADTIDDTLTDPDPQNPVTVAGLSRRSVLAMGITSTPAAAAVIGQDWLAQQKLLSTAGQASIVGVVQDSSGVTWPAWMIRAGDSITFVDAHDPVPRRIVKSSYSDDTKVNQLDLDSPPDGLQSLLARLGIADAVLGF